MLHRIPRSVRWALLVAVLGAVTVSVVQSWTSAAPGTGGWTQTQWGPIGPADRDFLVKVRQAGLWEIPTGQQMAQQATNQQVRETGQHLAEQHTVLDQLDRDVSDKLGVQLPSRASDQQIAWMNQISSTTGTDYDKVAVQLLRQAHGIVLPVVATTRVGTRNELVRQFADTTFQYVTGHIAMLEATGLVDYSALPEAPSPGIFGGGTSPADMIVPVIVFLAAAGAAVGLLVTLRRGRRKPPAVAAAATGSQLAALHSPAVVTVPAPRDTPDPPALPGGSPAGHRRRRGDTGGIPVVDVLDERAGRVSDTGRTRATTDSGRYRAVSATDRSRAVTDTGRTRAVTDTGRTRSVEDSGRYRASAVDEHPPVSGRSRATTDSGRYRVPAEPGRRRRGDTRAGGVEDTGSHRARTADSGGYAAVPRRRRASDSGNFRFDDLLDPQDTGAHSSGRGSRRRS
ncbi:hypothetical protein GCM10009836_71350 [Pseudonocardia ailaonensis]|uniref:DUF4142 domain-containing protein n=1 Tax=Pseudonocardia ailaonensis TaxID=367279 RepID=A0ABN2NP71_9PSEU